VPERPDDLPARIAVELTHPEPMDPTVDARVMALVRAEARRRPWLLRRRAYAWSPLGLLLRAAAVAAIAVGVTLAASHLRSASPAAAPAHEVAFVLYAPGAASVAVAGDFNAWSKSATPLHPTGSGGAWVVTVPLAPGRYHYAFLVDGKRWVTDPGAAPAPGDDFGTPSSVMTVGRG